MASLLNNCYYYLVDVLVLHEDYIPEQSLGDFTHFPLQKGQGYADLREYIRIGALPECDPKVVVTLIGHAEVDAYHNAFIPCIMRALNHLFNHYNGVVILVSSVFPKPTDKLETLQDCVRANLALQEVCKDLEWLEYCRMGAVYYSEVGLSEHLINQRGYTQQGVDLLRHRLPAKLKSAQLRNRYDSMMNSVKGVPRLFN